jgi:hypothetical protein
MALDGLRRWVAGAGLAATLATSSVLVFAAPAGADPPSCTSSNNTRTAPITCPTSVGPASPSFAVGAPSEGSLTDSRGNFGSGHH